MVSYDVYLHNGHFDKIRNDYCFSDYYHTAALVRKWVIFIQKDWMVEDVYEESYRHHISLTEEEIREYVKLLNDMGFFVKMRDAKGWDRVWAFEIENNSVAGTLVLINSIRDIYEDGRDQIIKTFLSYSKESSELSLWNRFILAHYDSSIWMGHGHTFLPYYATLKLLSDQEFGDCVLNADDLSQRYLSEHLPSYPITPTRLFGVVSGRCPLSTVYQTYKEEMQLA